MSQPDQPPVPEADAYYGDDDVSSEELDLSFLDQDDDKPADSK
ncbi:MAG TPA: hypothetical protein VLA88_03310 [Candidatus Saccharimonadales bacterium]|nr:hypothetical protein [Candidatus Saccharimonadales bacterium]